MLLHKNGRFIIGNLSFKLPDNMFLSEFTDDNWMKLKTNDDAITCVLCFSSNFRDAKELLKDNVDTCDAMEKHIFVPVHPVKLTNVEGYHVRYSFRHPAARRVIPVSLVDEHAFAIHDGENIVIFNVHFRAYPHANLEHFDTMIDEFISNILIKNQ